jgi:guanylate kinase
MPDPGLLLVMTGPSGAGKSSLVRGAQRTLPELEFSVSCTTRAMRRGEVEGVDYFFVDPGDFERRQARGEFLESATVHGNSYGTPSDHVARRVAAGAVVILDIDVQGAAQVRASGTEAVFLFVLPPSFDVLEARLRGRATDTDEVIRGRLDVARSEMAEAPWFDYQVINDDLDRAIAELLTVVDRERTRKVRAEPGT